MVETIYMSNGITLQEINEHWTRTEMSGGMPMIRQTFNRHRKAIQDMLGINIECRTRGGYRYYIKDKESLKNNSFKSWMLDSLSINNILMDSGSLKERLLMEHIPAGKEYFQAIINAMKVNHKIKITYHKFGSAEPYSIVVEPYAIKVFKQRWYLLAKNYKREAPTVYALDRMEAVEELAEHFTYPADFSIRMFFHNSYGVMFDPNLSAQRIVVRAYPPFTHYLRTLPLHHSQTELTDTPEYADFEFYLCPTFDFKQELLAQGKDVEVLKPASLREEMKQMLWEAMERYKD
jgi:hypothetical protein